MMDEVYDDIDDDNSETVGGMNDWLGKQEYSEKSLTVSVFPPQIPNEWTGLEPGPPLGEVGH
jgi:hypothetical protein